MPRSSGNPLLPLALLVAVLASGGCDTKSCGLTEGVSQPVGPWGAGLGEARPSRARQIMARLGKGSQALTAVIGAELEAAQPPWEALQPQAKEYAELAAALARSEPRRGSKEAWEKQTAAYADAAAALDHAAQARDQEAARAAHGRLAEMCLGCHREHR